jgi:hypothetical protein
MALMMLLAAVFARTERWAPRPEVGPNPKAADQKYARFDANDQLSQPKPNLASATLQEDCRLRVRRQSQRYWLFGRAAPAFVG